MTSGCSNWLQLEVRESGGELEAPGRFEGPQIQQDLTPGFHMDFPRSAVFQEDWDPSRRGAPDPAGEGQCRCCAECLELRYPERK